MTKQIARDKWILYRHTRNFSLLCSVAKILKSFSKQIITKEEKEIKFALERFRAL